MTASSPKPIAYLTALLPALSHTFILREIRALEAEGLRIDSVSVRKPDPETIIGDDEKRMFAQTCYLLDAARNPFTLLAAQIAALRHPFRYAKALHLAWKTRPPGLHAAIYQIFYFIEATLLARYVATHGCGRIHNHFANSSGTVAMLASRLSGVPFSFTLHGPSDLFDAKTWRLDYKVAEADFVACISHFARSQAMLHADPEHWSKLKIVHCGVDPKLYGTKTRPKNDKTRLIFVGRLAPVKGLRILVESFTSALQDDPDLELVIVGDGPDRTALTELALSAGDAVRFTGPLSQDEVASALAQADMMILPSFAEGVPVVLMEAMATGLPVIATRVAGVSELVEDGTNGRLVAPGDTEGLTSAILSLAADPELRRRMGTAGRQKVQAEFDIAQEARWLAQIFRNEAAANLRPQPH